VVELLIAYSHIVQAADLQLCHAAVRTSFASPGEAGKIESNLLVSGHVYAASPAVWVRLVMVVS
jgi:hypothetical protein